MFKQITKIVAVAIFASTIVGFAYSANAQDVTTIKITDKVKTKDCINLGINFNASSSNAGKSPLFVNFEGGGNRLLCKGILYKDGFVNYWYGNKNDYNEKDGVINKNSSLLHTKGWIGGEIRIITGLGLGEKRKIVSAEFRDEFGDFWKKEKSQRIFYKFDRPIEGLPEDKRVSDKMLIDTLKTGSKGAFNKLHQTDPFRRVCVFIEKNSIDEGATLNTNNKRNLNIYAVKETYPNAFGYCSLMMEGQNSEAQAVFEARNLQYETAETGWELTYWAKIKKGAPKMKFIAQLQNKDFASEPAPLTKEWAKHSIVLNLKGNKIAQTKQGRLDFLLNVTGGNVLLDDVQIRNTTKYENPTAYTDDMVNVLKYIGAGVLRRLQCGGSSVHNYINTRDKQISGRGGSHANFSYNCRVVSGLKAPEYYTLAEHIGASPWLNLPGTLTNEEVGQLVEYLAAPADVGLGKLRASQGHPKPWTETFPKIYLEFGNESWNYMSPYLGGGWNGPDYWRELIKAGKASKYYKKNIIFNMGTHGSSDGIEIMENSPNADSFAFAPYVVQGKKFFGNEGVAEQLDTTDKHLRWVFYHSLAGHSRIANENADNRYAYAKKHGFDIAVYEFGYHTNLLKTKLQKKMANMTFESRAGGVNLINCMLTMMKNHEVKTQCLHCFQASSGPKSPWHNVKSTRADNVAYRPTIHAMALANNVINGGGDLVETIHSGLNPYFEPPHIDMGGKKKKHSKSKGISKCPVIHSYAFTNGNQRGLILVSLDTLKDQKIKFDLGSSVKNVKSWVVTSDKITDENSIKENDKVIMKEFAPENFVNGGTQTLKPCSMYGFTWTVK